jgi:hypothetical protein
MAAAKAGRSVSEEIEYRLDRSFYEDALPARMAETMAPLVDRAARAGGEAALKVHLAFSRPETDAERQERIRNPAAWDDKRQQIEFEGAREGRTGAAFDWLRELMDAFANVYGFPVNSHRELMMWAYETPQGRAAIDKIRRGKTTTPEQK